MRKTILDNLKTGLNTELGIGSSVYGDLFIEDIQTRLPDTITTNTFIGIVILRATSASKEIGRYAPTMKEYECMIVVHLKGGDYDIIQDELDTIVNRVTKYLSKDTGNLGGASKTKDGITERVVSYSVDEYNYDLQQAREELAAACGIILSIKTDLTIN